MDRMEERVMNIYCSCYVSIMNPGYDIIPSTAIAKMINCTLYKARKAIHSLVDRGLLEAAIGHVYDEEYGEAYICRGYRLTNEGKKSLQYRKAKWEEAKICSEIWGYDSPYGYYKSLRI